MPVSTEIGRDVSATASSDVVATGEKLMRIITFYMNLTTVLDTLPEHPLARQAHGISPDGSLFSEFSVRSFHHVASYPK